MKKMLLFTCLSIMATGYVYAHSVKVYNKTEDRQAVQVRYAQSVICKKDTWYVEPNQWIDKDIGVCCLQAFNLLGRNELGYAEGIQKQADFQPACRSHYFEIDETDTGIQIKHEKR